ncbi:MAG: sulfate reduction electron transfer complex DsrMKJOP subunit DsrP [bacterium]
MLEKALIGSRRYYGWLFFLLVLIGAGVLSYLWQFFAGLGITGLGRDVSWGFYIAQFTFLVGVAASAVMLVLPYYLHHYKQFGKITILGEFLAVSSVLMCMLFIFVDMGQPLRVLNIILHPTPNSIMFWDMIVLSGYLLLNIVIGWVVLDAEHKEMAPPGWVKPLIYLSIPWAVSIHTVTAFLYAGLPGRHLWLTAIMAARFLSSAFASGPALLILLAFIVRKTTRFDPGREPIQKLAQIVAYAMILNVFFSLLEVFTAFYSGIPSHMQSLQYLFAGLEGHASLVPFMRVAVVLAVAGIALLVVPSTRKNEKTLAFAAAAVFVAAWIDKGMGLVVGGFIPNPFERIVEYAPTAPELLITLGVWAIGFFVLTLLYKIAISVKEEVAA